MILLLAAGVEGAMDWLLACGLKLGTRVQVHALFRAHARMCRRADLGLPEQEQAQQAGTWRAAFSPPHAC
jgi:hypothetical protein